MIQAPTIFDTIRRLAKSGLGHEDIAVRLHLSPAEAAVAKQIVLKKQVEGKAA